MKQRLLGKLSVPAFALAITAIANLCSVSAQAQDFSLTAEGSDPTVMVVKGYGDISNATGTAPKYQVFTTEGAANVRIKNGDNWDAITAGTTYNAGNSYAYGVPTFTPLESLTDAYATSSTIWNLQSLTSGQHVYAVTAQPNVDYDTPQLEIPTETNEYVEVTKNGESIEYKSKVDNLYVGTSDVWGATQIKSGDSFTIGENTKLWLRIPYQQLWKQSEVTDGSTDFGQANITIDGQEYAGYIITNDEWNDGSLKSNAVTLISTSDLESKYKKKVYTAVNPNSLYGGNTEDGTDKTVLSTFDDGAYTYFWTRSDDWKPIENNPTYFTENSSYLEEKTGEAKSFLDAAAEFATNNSCKAIRFEQDNEHSDSPLTLTVDAVNSIINLHNSDQYGNVTYLFPISYSGSTKYFIDFSNVKVDGEDFVNNVKASTYNAVSIVLPETLTSDQANTLATGTFGQSQNISNLYWYSENSGKKVLNAYITSDREIPTTQKLTLDKDAKTIVALGNNFSHTSLSGFDVKGIDNLVLDHIAQIAGIGASDFDAYQNVKRVILPDQSKPTFLDNAELSSSSSVGVLQFVATQDNTDPSDDAFVSKVFKPGTLVDENNVELTHYTDSKIENVVCTDFSGAITENDFTFFNKVNTERLNLSKISFSNLAEGTTAEAKLNTLDNDNIYYLALPDMGALPSDPKFGTLFTQCSNLRGVGQYTGTVTADGESSSVNRFTAYLTQAGQNNMTVLATMLSGNTGNMKNVKELKLGGYLTFWDIRNGGPLSGVTPEQKESFDEGYIGTDGHLTSDHSDPTKILSGDGISGGLNGLATTNLSLLDLTDAIFEKNLDMNLTTAGITPKVAPGTIKLPVSHLVSEIPHYCLYNLGSAVTSICIPGNIKKIGRYAFSNNTQLTHIYTTDIDGNGDGVGDIEDKGVEGYGHSITLPAALEYIGRGAFHNVDKINDVYVLSTGVPPVCEQDAFNSSTLYGWGGYNSKAPVTKKNYVTDYTDPKNATQQSFGILHWPSGLTKQQVMCYTDIDRKYSIQDGLQTTDGDGHTYIWPNQTEYDRAYAQGTFGYTWDAWPTGLNDGLADNWDPTMSQYAADQYYLKQAEATGDDSKTKNVFYSSPSYEELSVNHFSKGVWHDPTTVTEGEYPTADEYASKSPNVKADADIYGDRDYRGWHQFVLTGSVNYKDPDPVFDVTRFNTNDWYSVCLPFDIDKAKLLEIFGAKAGSTVDGKVVDTDQFPNVTTLYKVVRSVKNKAITMWFTDNMAARPDTKADWDLSQGTWVESPSNDNGDQIIMKAGYPYLIKPILPETITKDVDIRSYAKQRLVNYDPKDNSVEARDYNTTWNEKLPYMNWFVTAIDDDGNPCEYKYTSTDSKGNETTQLGDYTYLFQGMYHQQDTIPMYSYFLANNGKNNVWYYNIWTFEQYGQPWNSNTTIVAPLTKPTVWKSNTKNHETSARIKLTPIHDVLTDKDGKPVAQAKTLMGFGGNGVTTEIKGITANGRLLTEPIGKVYNLSGQYIGEDIDLSTLPKGVYVVGGKKYVVQ